MSNTYTINQTNTNLPNYNTGTVPLYTTGTGPYSITSPSITTWTTSTTNTLQVDGNVVINGKDLEKRLSVIEKVLNIPERDVKLEAKYPKLKKMYEDYINELSKARMWESIKGDEK